MPEKIRMVVKKELADSGMSQRELSRRSGVAQDIVNRYLAGKKEIQTDTLARLLRVFGKTVRSVELDAKRRAK